MGELLSNNTLFNGSATARMPSHNTVELTKKTYFNVGQIMALSIVHGGPAPKCLADPIADYIVHGMDKVKASTNDVSDIGIRLKLQQVIHTLIVLITVIPHLGRV